MHFLRRLVLSRFRFRPPPSVARYNKLATAGTKTTAIAMAAYVCTVAAAAPVPGGAPDKNSKDHHVKNSRGETIKFQNPYPSHAFPPISLFAPAVLKMMFSRSATPKPKLEDKLVPVVKPQFLPTRTASSELRATWLGHACYYVEYPSGLRVLFDPVFEDCCAPVNFMGFKRYTERPCDIADIPFVDAVVISHSHYDHLSYPSVQEVQKHHPNAHFFVGLGLEKWFKSSGVDNVTEMDWWDEKEVTFTPKLTNEADTKLEPIKATISCLPSQHSSGRTGLDRDHTLWASWGVKSSEKTVWFGGDTGYRTVPRVAEGIDDWGPEFQHLPVCPQFRQIGEHLGSVDLGLIPIGAYQPRHIFSHMHANPYDSVEIFQDTKCKRAMAIHWGTWVLTPEHPLEPPKLLKEALKRKGMPETGVFDVCDIGESRAF
ncbi:NAPE-hydrolyzing phospholipase D [Xylaria longipes]|nr:NAPE-hydrolyzing phospholipase D [Xylaria longipes]